MKTLLCTLLCLATLPAARAQTIAEQEGQLKASPLLQHFRDLRHADAADPWKPAYHFSSPEARLNDPNGLCFWQGRWHLFYQAKPPNDNGSHWAHAVSDDLIHWRDLPFAIDPGPEISCYSGAVMIEEGRAIAMYHGKDLGNMVAVSHDPLLLNWEKVTGDTVLPLNKDGKRYHFLSAEPLPYRLYDACIWKRDGVYYSLSGSVEYSGPGGRAVPAEFLFRSTDLAHWEFVHQFLEHDRFTKVGDDGACPYFWPIANRHILIFFSHTSSAQYLLGNYDTARDKFVADAHGRFSFGPVMHGGVQAPAAFPDGKGNLIAIFNMNMSIASRPGDGLMTLPRKLTLVGQEDLRQEPAGDLESLRSERQQVAPMTLTANREFVLPTIRGNALEIDAEIDAKNAPMVELNVLRSANREEVTRIALYRNRNVTTRFLPPQRQLSTVELDVTHASLLSEVIPRPPEIAPVEIPPGEPFQLRIFIDRSMVEVFVNGRQCVALRVHPSRADSLGVSLKAQGSEAELRSLEAWQMKSIYE